MGGLKTAGQRVRPVLNRATSALRALPDYLIIGAQKSGTTSLYRYLLHHPDVVPARQKEVHFFDRQFDRGPGHYRSFFPLRATLAPIPGVRSRRITGEASPSYLVDPPVAERAAALVPDARLIAVLRDPVERAYSHYRHKVRNSLETLPFAEALDAEADRLAGNVPGVGPAEALEHFSYVTRGLYAAQLERWLAVFPREHLLVLDSQDLFVDPERVYQRVVDFLRLPEAALPDVKIYNRHGPSSAVDDTVRRRLEETFAEPNRRLKDLVGIDFERVAS